MTINVPTINDDAADFDALFALWSQVNGDGLDVTFDFSRCGFLRQNAVAFLGGLFRLIQSRAGTVRVDWTNMRDAVRGNLEKNGFRAEFNSPVESWWVGNSIPFRQDRLPDKAGLMTYLKSHWLGRGWVHVSEQLRAANALASGTSRWSASVRRAALCRRRPPARRYAAFASVACRQVVLSIVARLYRLPTAPSRSASRPRGPGHHFFAAFTIAMMPARRASGRSGHALTNSASSGDFRAKSAKKHAKDFGSDAQAPCSSTLCASAIPVSKTGWPARVTGVRIPPSPLRTQVRL